MKKMYTYLMMVLMLSMATTTFTSCETEDQYEATHLYCDYCCRDAWLDDCRICRNNSRK